MKKKSKNKKIFTGTCNVTAWVIPLWVWVTRWVWRAQGKGHDVSCWRMRRLISSSTSWLHTPTHTHLCIRTNTHTTTPITRWTFPTNKNYRGEENSCWAAGQQLVFSHKVALCDVLGCSSCQLLLVSVLFLFLYFSLRTLPTGSAFPVSVDGTGRHLQE